MRVELRSPGRRRASAPARAALLGCLIVLGAAAEAPGRATAPVVQGREGEVPEALNFANGLFQARRFDLAAKEYARFLATDPPRPWKAEALYGLANAHHFLQEYPEARAAFERFLEAAPEDHPSVPTALFRVGELAYVLGDLPAALRALDAYTQGPPAHRYQELAWPYLGDVRFRQGDLDGAREAYERSLRQFPDGRLSDRARLYLGRVLVRQGDRDAALARFRELIGRPGAAQRDEAFYQVGRMELETGAFARAVEAFSGLEREVPQSSFLSRARLGKAEALAALDRVDEAAEVLGPLRDDPSAEVASRAAYLLGLGQLKRGRTAEALAVFDEALGRFADTSTAPALLYRSAEALERQGDLDGAASRFERLAESYPDDAWADDALVQAAAIALRLGRGEHAAALARRAMGPSRDGPLAPAALLIEARAGLDAGDADGAIRILEELLALPEVDPELGRAARYYLGLASRSAGRSDEALRVLEGLARDAAAPYAVDVLYLVGQGHFDAGRFEEAIDALGRYVEARPDGDAADHALARIALAQEAIGASDEAAETMRRLADRFPESPVLGPTFLRLAESALAAERWEAAEASFRAAAEGADADPGRRSRALSGLGWALMGAGRLDAAAEAFKAVIDEVPDDPLAAEASYVRGRALRDLGRPDEAIEAFAWVVAHHPDSDDATRADLARARLLVAQARPVEASAIYERLLEDGGGSDPVEAPDLLLAELGWALLDAGDVEGADRAFARLLDEHPDSPHAADARLNLAESAFQRKRFDEAIALLEPLTLERDGEAEGVEPRILQAALFRSGRARVERQEWEEAASAFDRLVAEFPEGRYVREASFWAAEVAFRRGDPGAAEARFGAIIASVPEGREPEPWLPTARLRQIQALVQLERWADALDRAEALKRDVPDLPQMADLDYARGRALQGQAPPRFEEARAAYQAVIDARKGGELAAMAQFMRGETYFHQKNYEEALREFLKVDVLPSYDDAPKWQAMALLEAGKVYERLDRWADAADIYERLRARFPEDPAAAEADRRLAAARRRASGGEAVGAGSGSGRRG